MGPITRKSVGIDGKVFEDRRATMRYRVFKGAALTFDNGYGARECVVRNLSDAGAGLSFGDTTGVPPGFDLRISGENRVRVARVRWRTDTVMGVEFVRTG